MNNYKQSHNILDSLSQLIDNLIDIKNNCTTITPLEKDIILSYLRKAYVEILHYSAEEIVSEGLEDAAFGHDTSTNEKEIIEEEKMEIPTQEIDESEEEVIDEIEEEVKEDEGQSESLPLIEKNENEITAKGIDEIENRLKDMIAYMPKEEEENIVEDNEISLSEEEMEDHSSQKEDQTKKKEISQEEPTVSKIETLFGEEIVEKTPSKKSKTNVRSLNDLLQEQRDEKSVLSKIQQTKIDDLAKAISINDKFLFIRELFRNQSEEFSKAIQTLNRCQTIDEAFEEIERLKQFYFWDSTSVAYLTLCDLIRRKFA